MLMKNHINILTTSLCGKCLKSPLILGSGTLGEKKENLIKALKYGAGAVVNRTLRVDNTKREIFRPSYYINEHYMLNADNNNITPWYYWVKNAKEIEKYGPLIISLSARNPKDCDSIVSAFEENYSPSFYELNFSCSHSAKIYGRIGYEKVREALILIKEKTKKPVLIKVSNENLDINKLIELESEKLFDGYVISNTIGPGLKIDIKTRKPVLGSIFGGVSGPAIKPLVLAKIYELKQNTKKQIVGVGGIETAEDVLEYLILGCDAVQIYTKAHIYGVKIFNELNKDLKEILKDMGETIKTIKGTLEIRS